ncbi:hypothetical protein F2P79_009957 [Pimephales promelas]|nr:hypothetical protein F2P79_009957 [Pimephales promelas]
MDQPFGLIDKSAVQEDKGQDQYLLQIRRHVHDVKANCITPFPLPFFSLMAHIRYIVHGKRKRVRRKGAYFPEFSTIQHNQLRMKEQEPECRRREIDNQRKELLLLDGSTNLHTKVVPDMRTRLRERLWEGFLCRLEEQDRRQSESEGDRESEGGSQRHRSESFVLGLIV